MLTIKRLSKLQSGKPSWPPTVLALGELMLFEFVDESGREFSAKLKPAASLEEAQQILAAHESAEFLAACEQLSLPSKELVGKYEVSKEEAARLQKLLDRDNETRALINQLLKPPKPLELWTLEQFLASVELPIVVETENG